MIEKLKRPVKIGGTTFREKINELVDAVNTIQKEREAERFEIQEWIGILESVRKSVNKHKDIIRQIGEWGSSKGECLWCENLTKVNLDDRMIGCTTLDIPKSYKTDPYAKYRKWNGKLCRFWDAKKDDAIYDILEEVIADWSYRFKSKSDYIFDHCEPVKPDDDIIYKGGDNEQ